MQPTNPAPTPQTSTPYVVLVAVDYSETGGIALERALELAATQPNAEPHVVHVASLYGSELRIDLPDNSYSVTVDKAAKQLEAYVHHRIQGLASRLPAQGFARVCVHERIGNPAEEIAQLASDLEADLVIVGTHGRRGPARLLIGSVAEGVVRLAPCPVLVVRPKALPAVPHIQPPCPRCVAERAATAGKEFWCEPHRTQHGHRHGHNYVQRASANTNMPLLFPLGR